MENLDKFTRFIDNLRIFPRIFIAVYIYVFYNVVEWFMDLTDPNMAQAGLVSVVVGAGAAWFGLYVNSGESKKVAVPEQNPQVINVNTSPSSQTNQTGYMPGMDERD